MKDLIVLSYKESEESILLHQALKGKRDWSETLPPAFELLETEAV